MSKVEVSAEQKSQYDAKAKESFDKIVGLLSDMSQFKLSKEDKGVKLYSRYDKDSSFAQVLSSTVVDAPLDAVLSELCNVPIYEPSMDKAIRGESLIQEYYPIESPGEYNDGFVYCLLESPTRLVSKRDFLMYRKHFEKDGVHYFIHISVEYPGVRQPTKENVRGQIFQVDIAQADPQNKDKTILQYFVHADPSGSIPAWVYNLTAESSGYDVLKVRDRVLQKK